MQKVTKEIITNETGKEIKNSIDNLRDTVIAANTAKYDKEATLLEVVDARGGYTSLGQRLNNTLQPDTNYLTMNRIYRQFIENGKHIDYSLHTNYFGNIQGCTYIDDNKAIIACMSSDDYNLTNNQVKLYEINISNSTIIREKVLELNHANSLAYDRTNNILYCVSGSKYVNGTRVLDNQLFKIDYNTLEIITSKTFENHISSVAYDNISERLIVGYIADNFYELDNNLNITETYEIDKPDFVANAGIQGCELHNNKLYCLIVNPDAILVYNLETRKTDKIYSVKPYSNDDNFFIGEIEDISFIGDNTFMLFSNALTTYYSQQNQLNIFEINLKTNVMDNNTYLVNRGYLSNNINAVYVDASNTNTNPTGSQENPFKEIYEAITLLNSGRYNGTGRIYVANGTYKNIFFYGNDIEIKAQNSSNPDVNIEGVMAINSKVYFENCNFEKNNASLNYPIKIEKSYLYLKNPTIDNTSTYQIHSTESEIVIDGNIEKDNLYLDKTTTLKLNGSLYIRNGEYFDNDGDPTTEDVPKVSIDGMLNICDGHLKFFADMDGDGDYDADMYSKDNMYLSCGNATHIILGQGENEQTETYGRIVFNSTANTNFIQSGKNYSGTELKHLAFSPYRSGDYYMIFNKNSGFCGVGKYYSSPQARLHVNSDETTLAVFENHDGANARIAFKGTNQSDYNSATIGLAGNILVLRNNNVDKLRIDTGNYVLPGIKEVTNLGSSAYPWANIYSVNSVTVTSDKRSKTDISNIDEKIFEAWEHIEYKQYKLKNGDDKIHFGILAQDIVEEFEKVGLNALDYGLVVYDEENDIYNVRYDEVNIIENAYMRYLRNK